MLGVIFEPQMGKNNMNKSIGVINQSDKESPWRKLIRFKCRPTLKIFIKQTEKTQVKMEPRAGFEPATCGFPDSMHTRPLL